MNCESLEKCEMRNVWTTKDQLILINRVKLFTQDLMLCKYKYVRKQLDWEGIAFEQHDARDCKRKWKQIQKECLEVKSIFEIFKRMEKVVKTTSGETSHRRITRPKAIRLPTTQSKLPTKPKTPLEFLFEKQLVKRPLLDRETKKSRMLMIRNKYRKMSDERKSKYILKAHEDMQRYSQQLDFLAEKNPDFCITTLKMRGSNLTKEEKKILENILKKENFGQDRTKVSRLCEEEKDIVRRLLLKRPKAPPQSAFHLFVQRHMNGSQADIFEMRKLTQAWKTMTDEEKRFKFGLKLRRLKESHRKSLKDFENTFTTREKELTDMFLQNRYQRIKTANKLKIDYEEPEEDVVVQNIDNRTRRLPDTDDDSYDEDDDSSSDFEISLKSR